MLSAAVLAVVCFLQVVWGYDELVVRIGQSPAQGSMFDIVFEPSAATPLNQIFVWWAVTNPVTLNASAVHWPQTQSEWVLAGKIMNLPCLSSPEASLCELFCAQVPYWQYVTTSIFDFCAKSLPSRCIPSEDWVVAGNIYCSSLYRPHREASSPMCVPGFVSGAFSGNIWCGLASNSSFFTYVPGFQAYVSSNVFTPPVKADVTNNQLLVLEPPQYAQWKYKSETLVKCTSLDAASGESCHPAFRYLSRQGNNLPCSSIQLPGYKQAYNTANVTLGLSVYCKPAEPEQQCSCEPIRNFYAIGGPGQSAYCLLIDSIVPSATFNATWGTLVSSNIYVEVSYNQTSGLPFLGYYQDVPVFQRKIWTSIEEPFCGSPLGIQPCVSWAVSEGRCKPINTTLNAYAPFDDVSDEFSSSSVHEQLSHTQPLAMVGGIKCTHQPVAPVPSEYSKAINSQGIFWVERSGSSLNVVCLPPRMVLEYSYNHDTIRACLPSSSRGSCYAVAGVFGAPPKLPITSLKFTESPRGPHCFVPPVAIAHSYYDAELLCNLYGAVVTLNRADSTVLCTPKYHNRGPQASSAVQFIGCFVTSSEMQVVSITADSNSPLSCRDACLAFGSEHNTHFSNIAVSGRMCMCGLAHDYASSGAAVLSQCSTTCPGDSSSTCGGSGKSSVYDIGTFSVVTQSQPDFLGCWKDDANSRAMPVHAYGFQSNNSPIKCMRACLNMGRLHHKNYAYIGIENGNSCWCSDSVNHWQVHGPSSECTLNCADGAGWSCGGGYALSVYRVEPIREFQLDGFHSCRPAFQWVPMLVSRNTLDTSVCQNKEGNDWCQFGGGEYTSLWDSAYSMGGFAHVALSKASKANNHAEYMRTFMQVEALKMKYFTLTMCTDYADPNCAFGFDFWELSSYTVPQSSSRSGGWSPDSYIGIGTVRNKCRGMSIVSGGFSSPNGCPKNLYPSTNSEFDAKTSLFGMCSSSFSPPMTKSDYSSDQCTRCRTDCPASNPFSEDGHFCAFECKKYCIPPNFYRCFSGGSGVVKCQYDGTTHFGGRACMNCWWESTVLTHCLPTRWVRPVTAENAKGSGGFGAWNTAGAWDPDSPEWAMSAAYDSPNMMMNTFAWPAFSYLQFLKSPVYPPTFPPPGLEAATFQYRLGSAMYQTTSAGQFGEDWYLCCSQNTFPQLTTQDFEACFGDEQCIHGISNCNSIRPGCTTQNRDNYLNLQTQHEIIAYHLSYASGTPGVPETAFVSPPQETVSEMQWSCHSMKAGNKTAFQCAQHSPAEYLVMSRNLLGNLSALVLEEPRYVYNQGLLELFIGLTGTSHSYSAGDLKSSADADATCEFTFTGKCQRGWFLALNVPSQSLCCSLVGCGCYPRSMIVTQGLRSVGHMDAVWGRWSSQSFLASCPSGMGLLQPVKCPGLPKWCLELDCAQQCKSQHPVLKGTNSTQSYVQCIADNCHNEGWLQCDYSGKCITTVDYNVCSPCQNLGISMKGFVNNATGFRCTEEASAGNVVVGIGQQTRNVGVGLNMKTSKFWWPSPCPQNHYSSVNSSQCIACPANTDLMRPYDVTTSQNVPSTCLENPYDESCDWETLLSVQGSCSPCSRLVPSDGWASAQGGACTLCPGRMRLDPNWLGVNAFVESYGVSIVPCLDCPEGELHNAQDECVPCPETTAKRIARVVESGTRLTFSQVTRGGILTRIVPKQTAKSSLEAVECLGSNVQTCPTSTLQVEKFPYACAQCVAGTYGPSCRFWPDYNSYVDTYQGVQTLCAAGSHSVVWNHNRVAVKSLFSGVDLALYSGFCVSQFHPEASPTNFLVPQMTAFASGWVFGRLSNHLSAFSTHSDIQGCVIECVQSSGCVAVSVIPFGSQYRCYVSTELDFIATPVDHSLSTWIKANAATLALQSDGRHCLNVSALSETAHVNPYIYENVSSMINNGTLLLPDAQTNPFPSFGNYSLQTLFWSIASISNAGCVPCSIGSFSPTAGFSCVPCYPGSYQNLTGQTSCHACGKDTFSSTYGMSECPACPANSSTVSVGGPCEFANGTIASRVVAPSQLFCKPGTNMRRGLYSISGRLIGVECQNCTIGSFTDQYDRLRCTSCNKGYSSMFPFTSCYPCTGLTATVGNNRVCETCALNTVPNARHDACQPCGIGTGRDSQTETECQVCEGVTYNAGSTGGACIPCGVDSHPSSNHSMCLPCPKPTGRAVTAMACTPCGVGTYWTENAQAIGMPGCAYCPRGQYQNKVGRLQCIKCSPGLIPNRLLGATKCVPPFYFLDSFFGTLTDVEILMLLAVAAVGIYGIVRGSLPRIQ